MVASKFEIFYMKKHVFGRKFKRDINERKALFKGLMSSLVLYEKIETTESKAKAIKGEVDKLVTNAKKESNLARKLLSDKLSPEALEKMIKDIAPRFNKRQGGYTKMVRLGKRFGDDATMVLVEWAELREVPESTGEVKKTKRGEKSKKLSKAKSASGGKKAKTKPKSKTKRSVGKNG